MSGPEGGRGAPRELSRGEIDEFLRGQRIARLGCSVDGETYVVPLIYAYDEDGAVVIPQALVGFVAEEGAEHERYEGWVVSEVENGVKLPGLYPPNDEAKARYEAWKKRLG